MQDKLDLYTDLLLSTTNKATASGFSKMLEGTISHDFITRLLRDNEFSSKDLWHSVKPLFRQHQTEDGLLIFDDSIIEKPYTDQNALVCWHFEHSTNSGVKGNSLLTAFYHAHHPDQDLALRVPVSFELILKTIHFCDVKTKREKRQSPVTKNDLLRQMVQQNIHKQLKFKYVLADSWFGSSKNMLFIHGKKKFFIFDIKSNRNAVLNEKDRNLDQWTRIDELELPDNKPVKVGLKDLNVPLLITKQVFKNKNQSTGVRFLVSNDFSWSDDDFTTRYKKRWSV